MGYVIVSETFEEIGNRSELLLCCDSMREALRVHDIATNLGFSVVPKSQDILVRLNSARIRILLNSETDRVLLKLAL